MRDSYQIRSVVSAVPGTVSGQLGGTGETGREARLTRAKRFVMWAPAPAPARTVIPPAPPIPR
jgi:hypothetical protein